MGGADTSGSGAAKSEPNVVPLCDILLVLLIIFMVITPISQSGMDIRMPEGEGTNTEAPVVLSIGEDGVIKVNRESYNDLDLLEERLRGIFEPRSTKIIFVRSSDRLIYQRVVDVLDKVKGAGIDTICMMTETYRERARLH